MKNFANMNMSQKLISSVISILFVVQVSVGGLCLYITSKMARDLQSSLLRSKLIGDIQYSWNLLEKYHGKLAFKDNMLWDKSGNTIEGNYELVDKIKKDLLNVATVFVKKDDDFYRVITNVVTEDGKRAVGTALGKSSAAYDPLMKGERYLGDAKILGKQYLTLYDPIKDENGNLIGILFIGIEIEKEESANIITASIYSMIQNVLLVSVFFLILGIVLMVVLVRSIVGSIHFIVDQLKAVTQKAEEGELSVRVGNLDSISQEFRPVAKSVNSILDAVVRPIQEVGTIMKNISQGDLTVKMQEDYKGDYAKLKDTINGTINSLAAILTEITIITKAGNEGNLSVRGDLSKINFGFQPIIQGVNDTLDAVVGPVNEIISVMKNVSHGDLTVKMQGDYKGDYITLKNAINETIFSLSETLTEIISSFSLVDSGAEQVASASESLSQGATESASSLEEITSSMNEIGGQAKNNADNSAQAKKLSEEAKESSELGNEQMKKMVNAMSEINNSSEKIAKIIKAIDEIAFQTNLLALNATVEAARAGKHGKGFAVVAKEVKNLAARSALAAKETTVMINDTSKKVSDGTIITKETAKSLDEITNSTTKVTNLISEISVASGEQSKGVSQIVIALGQIDKVTQQNTASAEESASAAKELSGQSAQLKTLVSRFKLS